MNPESGEKKRKLKRDDPKSKKKCSRCGTCRGVINKYHIKLCRRCFKDLAEKIGFKKFG